jgi:hypothetical protein
MIRSAEGRDVRRMADLAAQGRESYAVHAPVFHRPHTDARARHEPWLMELVGNPEQITLVSESDSDLDGFVIGSLVRSPPVYDPGGLTCVIDDFIVERPDLWATVGRELLEGAAEVARAQGAAQTVVVCGPVDGPKRTMLIESGHIVASEWFTRSL